MDVRVVLLVIIDQRRDYGTRLLRGRGRIEIDQALSPRRGSHEDRKIGGNGRRFGWYGGTHQASFAATAARISSRKPADGKRSIAGSKNPKAIIRSAASASMPRLCK